jgi:ATP-dependent Lhr-like helicase
MSDASRHDLRDDRQDGSENDLAVLPEPFALWFAARGWTPRSYQLGLLQKARAGPSTLLITPTGAGKTLAGFLPTLVEFRQRAAPASSGASSGAPSGAPSGGSSGGSCAAP